MDNCGDFQAPIITVIAQSATPLLVSQCSDYVDPGAIASDNLDDNELLTQQIVTTTSTGPLPLDTSILGVASVFYVSDRGKKPTHTFPPPLSLSLSRYTFFESEQKLLL